MTRFFISHASADKPLALELKRLLDGNAWVDLHELDVGDLLLKQISDGIENASDFTLLWSESSAESRWVSFELHMAFIRWLEDSAIAIRVIRLDTTPVPLYLRPFLQARGATDAASIAKALAGERPAPHARKPFLNRNQEIGAIEEALYGVDVRALFVCGLPGIGKRSLVREALTRLTIGANASHTISVTAATAETELNLLVSRAVGGNEVEDGSGVHEALADALAKLEQFAELGGIWVFEGVEHWLREDGAPGRILSAILEGAYAREGYSRLIILTSRRRPRIAQVESRVSSFFLNGLAAPHGLMLLKNLGASQPDAELVSVVKELDGHPLALEVVAPRLPLTAADLREQRHEIATDLVDPSTIAPATWLMLELLALADGPLAGEDLAAMLETDADGFKRDVAEASHYSLVVYDGLGSLSLHPLVRDYFLRSFRSSPKHKERTARVAEYMRTAVERLQRTDPQYVPSLLAAVKLLGLAGRFDEARDLRGGLTGTLTQTALELYHERRYAEALPFLDEALTGIDEVDRNTLQLKAKSLAYLGRLGEARDLGDHLVEANPTDPSVLRDRGRIEFIGRNWPDAISFFQKAIPHRHNPAQLWSDIAQARMRMDDWTGAVAAARIAIDRGGDTPWTLALYAEALENLDEVEEAERVMARAVSREPANAAYRHRLGRIAQRTGNSALAMEQFRKSGEIDGNYFQSLLSLASMLADTGELDGARTELERAMRVPGVPMGVSKNVEAKISLLSGNTSGAASSIAAALDDVRDAANIALAVRVWIARAEAGEVSTGQARAQVTSLSKELDSHDQLRSVLDVSREFPQYF